MNRSVFAWLARAELVRTPGRVVLAVIAIALGLALGYAVHLVNASALDEFAGALRQVNGDADLQVRARSGNDFDETLYERLAGVAEIAVASPVVEAELALPGINHEDGSSDGDRRLRVIGLDPLRAAHITPALLGRAGAATPDNRDAARLFDHNAIYLSPRALEALGKQVGQDFDRPALHDGRGLRIAGTLPLAPEGALLASMDIAAAQWRLNKLGRLSRIDLKLAPGVSAAAARPLLTRLLGDSVQLVSEENELNRANDLSRAYRVNLDMLALMALFTGAYLVYATQSLAVARRRAQLALLRVLGVGRAGLLGQILLEGAVLGAIGAALGLALGTLLAHLALQLLGGDLGGGYFQNSRPHLKGSPLAALAFFACGLAAALLGSLLPARAAARAQPAVALKSGADPIDPRHAPRPWPGLALLLAGALASTLPALGGIAVFAYLAMALLLFGGIALMPWLTRCVLTWPGANSARPLSLALARQHLWGAPRQAIVALCGVVTSVGLIVAMGVMIFSFRQSVDDWLTDLLPADLYARVPAAGDQPPFDAQLQQRLTALPGVTAARFQRFLPLRLDPDRPPVTLLVRQLGDDPRLDRLPLVHSAAPIPTGAVPVWGSEAMADLYGWRAGQTTTLPLGTRMQTVYIAGIWRDYARQHGAIILPAADYTRLTGEAGRSDVGFVLAPGVDPEAFTARLRAALPAALAARLEVSQPGTIRRLSLRIFDRSFAVTYVLQGVAILIGLLGVTATFSAQTLARSKEFGMLRHIGTQRAQIMAMLAWEGLLLGAVGVAAGLLLGLALGQVLIAVVNPQSFHWTMDTHIPWGLLGGVAAALLVATTAAAVLAGRHALSTDAVRAVREDW